jgi:hypothetical protein
VDGGSTADRSSKIITIDGAEKGNPAAVTQTLAHEIGHANYPLQNDFSSKSAYVKRVLGDEGAMEAGMTKPIHRKNSPYRQILTLALLVGLSGCAQAIKSNRKASMNHGNDESMAND